MVLVTPAPDGEVMSPEGQKKKKLTTLDKTDGRRLVEYLVVVSSMPRKVEEANPNNGDLQLGTSFDDEDVVVAREFKPTITARYPLEDHEDNPLHENVTLFCHPSGSIQLKKENYLPKVHYFVATGGTGKQMYGTCLTIWDPYTVSGRLRKPTGSESDEKEHEVFLPKCIVLLSTYPYLMAFREYLTQLHRLAKMGEMSLPIERYIMNLCAEIPAPPPGSFEVQTTIGESVIKIWSPPYNLPIPFVSLPYSYLFECLDVDNIVLVWHCLVLERQVLITSTQLSILTVCCETLLALLFPLRWSHCYISCLPKGLVEILSAPMPFLCGIDKANLADALYDLSPECVVVDLDKNLVTLGPSTAPLPPLPPYQSANLHAQLEDNVGMVFREVRSLTKNDDYSDSGSHLPSHTKQMAEAMWESRLALFDEAFTLMFTPEESRKNLLNGNDTSGMDYSDRQLHDAIRMKASGDSSNRSQSTWDAVQEAFLDTFVYLLRNYRKYLIFPSKHNEGSYGGAGFRSKEFIEAQRFDMREFLEQFIGTQMFDNFITKRLYGSGESDVAFFDLAVDQFLKNSGLLANVDVGGRLWQAAGFSQNADKKRVPSKGVRNVSAAKKTGEPLLQSARIHRKLKTIVPPEPSAEDLPPIDSIEGIVSVQEKEADRDNDDVSLGSHSTSSRSQISDAYKSVQDKAAQILGKSKLRYVYKSFPSEFREDLFGTPRPLPAAVLVEFERQRKDAAQFRRKKPVLQPKDKKMHIQRAHTTTDPETPPSAEVATFTVFFMAFTAMVGKELMEIDYDQDSDGKTILSTYVPTNSAYDTASETAATESNDGDSFKDCIDEEEQEEIADMKTDRPTMGGMLDEDGDGPPAQVIGNEAKPQRASNGTSAPKEISVPRSKSSDSQSAVSSSEPKSRFRDSLSKLQIEEAKATGRAQLGLAFEMLTMMKKRALKADPEAYQCLIDACGRVGDTKRATELLAKMHEDGIVADGTVYACLVSAFSAESAWRKGEKEEDLPEWANSTAVEMDWNKLQKRSLLDRLIGSVEDEEDEEEGEDNAAGGGTYQRIRKLIARRQEVKRQTPTEEQRGVEFYVTEGVERQIELGENLLEIVFPDISVDTDNETCPRCNFLLSDDDVVSGWAPGNQNEYTTSCPNCTQRFVPHFCVQSSSPNFVGSRGPSSPLMCERLSPWVLQKEIRSVMSDRQGIENLLSPAWREQEYKNAVLWWNLVLSCMRYRFPFTFILQGSFEQNLIAPMPEDDS